MIERKQATMWHVKNRKHELERASVERKFPAFSSFGGHVLFQFIIFSIRFFIRYFLGKKNFFFCVSLSLFRQLCLFAWLTHVLFFFDRAILSSHTSVPSVDFHIVFIKRLRGCTILPKVVSMVIGKASFFFHLYPTLSLFLYLPFGLLAFRD